MSKYKAQDMHSAEVLCYGGVMGNEPDHTEWESESYDKAAEVCKEWGPKLQRQLIVMRKPEAGE